MGDLGHAPIVSEVVRPTGNADADAVPDKARR
jgi:hypothetical protein